MKLMDEQRKETASEAIGLFLETFFATMKILEVRFAITKDNKILIMHPKTELFKRYTPKEFEKLYEKWEEEKGKISC